MAQTLSSNCPICDSLIQLPNDVEESEILNCPDCRNAIVVAKLQNGSAILEVAPQVEEDWGE
jgi:lysine biosynthesis protein LysW